MSRPRSYSDEDLTQAVADSRSWRGVLRALGLSATSSSAMRSVRRHADELGLDYAHFTGQRRWSDEQLARAIGASSSWREVVAVLGLADESSQTTLRGHAARLGIDVEHLRRTTSGAPPRQSTSAMEPSLRHLPRAGSLLAAGWFTLCGYDVSWPLEPCRYDLLVAMGGGIKRVQVETATVRSGSSWTVWLSTTRRGRLADDPEEIDYFFVVDGDLAYYLIPVQVVGGLHAITLVAYSEYRFGP